MPDDAPSSARILNTNPIFPATLIQKSPLQWTKSIAVIVSIVLHLLALWLVLRHQPKPMLPQTGSADQVTTMLILPDTPDAAAKAPSKEAPPSPPPIASQPRRKRESTPRIKPLPTPVAPTKSAEPSPEPPTPPVIALDKSLPSNSQPSAAPTPSEDDFSARLAARQRQRAAAETQEREQQQARGTPEQQANERGKQIALANIASQLRSAGLEKDDAGGLFQLKYVGPHHAEFLFRGWKKEARRNWSQQLEVEQGNESDIRIAVVKKMIEIIRDHTQGDFTWSSPRLGRQVNLSARREDSAGLQQFLLREFFPDFDPTAR